MLLLWSCSDARVVEVGLGLDGALGACAHTHGIPRNVQVPRALSETSALGAMTEGVLDVFIVVNEGMDVVKRGPKCQTLALAAAITRLLFVCVEFFPAEGIDEHGMFL